MSTWIDRFRNHTIWQHLTALGPVIDEAFSREGVDAATLDGLNRLKMVLAFIGQRLEGAEPNLIQLGPLDNISSYIQSATTEVQAFIANGTAGHITNANSHGDNALGSLVLLNVPIVTTDLVALREAAETYRSVIERNLGSLNATFAQTRTDIESLRSRLAEVTTDVTTEKQRLTILASEHQAQFSAAQELRSRDHTTDQQGRQEKFTELLAGYSQKLSEQTIEAGKQREALLKEHEVDLSKLSEEYRDKAKNLLKEITDYKAQVEKLVGIIGDLGVTSGYQKTAKQARWTSMVWQGIAVSALVVIIFIAFKAFLPVVQGEFTWEGFAGRIFLSVTVGLLAAYAISQADKHQQVERRSRKIALELEAIGPYLADLPKDKQEDFKLKIGERSFGMTQDLIDQHSVKSPKSVMDLLKSKELREFIAEIVRAGK